MGKYFVCVRVYIRRAWASERVKVTPPLTLSWDTLKSTMALVKAGLSWAALAFWALICSSSQALQLAMVSFARRVSLAVI